MKRVYRVVVRNSNESYNVMREGTRAECRHMILARWGHWPPFAVITTRTSDFRRRFE